MSDSATFAAAFLLLWGILAAYMWRIERRLAALEAGRKEHNDHGQARPPGSD